MRLLGQRRLFWTCLTCGIYRVKESQGGMEMNFKFALFIMPFFWYS